MKYLKSKKYSILSKISKYGFIVIIILSILSPFIFASADVTINTGINNPLRDDLNDIPSFIIEIIKIVMTVGVPIVALAIIYSGFLFVKAQGNQKELETAKKAILYTLIGAVLLLGAFVISNAIKTTVDDIKTGA